MNVALHDVSFEHVCTQNAGWQPLGFLKSTSSG
jgi:hypothetical protein